MRNIQYVTEYYIAKYTLTKLIFVLQYLLVESAYTGHIAAIKKMMSWGVKVTAIGQVRLPFFMSLSCISDTVFLQAALYEAIRGQDIEVIKLLLASGAQVTEVVRFLHSFCHNKELSLIIFYISSFKQHTIWETRK